MSTWEIARHQVAISGHVSDAETGKAVGGAEVRITDWPEAFKSTLEAASVQYGTRWDSLAERPDKTRSRDDGLFYFLDLPDGKYTLRARLPSFGKRYGEAQQEAVVSRDTDGRVKRAAANIPLKPTAVKGKIMAPGQKSGVLMAEVRVKGSGERTFSDRKGNYALTGIENGKRILQVFAQGYSLAEEEIVIATPGKSETKDFNLVREGK